MTIHCFVLTKISSSYSYVCSHEVEDGATVDNVSQAARESASKFHSRNPETTHVVIKLYQPTQPLEDKNKGTPIRDQLLAAVNDEYLEAKCYRVISKLDTSQECLIAIAKLSFDYAVFETIDGCKSSTCFLRGEVEDSTPSEVVRMVQKVVRQNAKRRLEAVNRGVLDIFVYETINAPSFFEGDLPEVGFMAGTSLLTPDGCRGEPVTPRGKGCLFVELLTVGYIEFEYRLFKEETVQNYTFVATGQTKGLLQQTVEVIGEAARGSVVDALENEDLRATNARVSVYGAKDKAPLGTLLDPGNQQFTAADLRNLTEYISTTSLDQVAGSVVVIFVPPKRPLEPIHEEGHSMDRATIAELARKRESPSTGAKHSALFANQRKEREDAVYNNRPEDLAGPPIQIYNSAFATFIREMSHSYDAMEFSEEELEQSLKFIDISLLLHEDEHDRRAKIHQVGVLGNILSSEVYVDARSIFPSGTTTIMCHSTKQEAIVRIVEVKNEVGEGGSDPIMQAECDFVLICSSKKYTPFRDASCCPMFLVGLAGPHLAVSEAIFAERFISQRLTDYLYVGPLQTLHGRSPADDSVRRVARVLRALRKGTDELIDYYSNLQFTMPTTLMPHSSSLRDPSLIPAPSVPISSRVVPPSFRKFTTAGVRYAVEYSRRLAPSFPAKAVFKAKIIRTTDKAMHDVVIKFTHMYCEDAHRKLAEVKRAPRMWFCDRVESVGMYVVVMDYEGGEQTDKPLECKAHIEQLREAVKTLHDAGYVHGDLRGPNVLVTASEGLKIIDFDWCGKEGEARYPADISLVPGLPWHDGVRRGGKITMEHDNYMLELLIQ